MNDWHLIEQSPACFSLLRQIIPPDQQGLVLACYQLVSERGRRDHPWIPRTPEVSYNPRAARIATLMMKEGRITNPVVIGAGMIAAGWAPSFSSEALVEALGIYREPAERSIPTRASQLALLDPELLLITPTVEISAILDYRSDAKAHNVLMNDDLVDEMRTGWVALLVDSLRHAHLFNVSVETGHRFLERALVASGLLIDLAPPSVLRDILEKCVERIRLKALRT